MNVMKKYFPIILTSLITAVLVAVIFVQFIIPPIQVNQEKNYSIKASDIVLSDKAERIFSASYPNDFIRAAEKGLSSVVFIESEVSIKNTNHLTRTVTSETGSGVIIDPQGTIVTNNHVIQGARRITVTLGDKREFQAEVIGSDKQTDLAVLKIEADNLKPLLLGNSDQLRIGEWVLAIGNPYRLRSSVTAGIVSAKARNINVLEESGIESFIQTDAAVNSGNSGGALVNTNGEIVGINTAIISSSGGYQGFSFAIPANLVRKVVRDIKEYGAVQRAWLGVTVENVTDRIAKDMHLNKVNGVRIVSTSYGGAAQEVGLKEGDVITVVNNIPIDAMPKFVETLGKLRPGDKATITYIRDGVTKTAQTILRNHLNSTDMVAVRKDKILTELGFELRDLDRIEVDRMGKDGVYVVSIYNESTISVSNMEPGYIITHINGEQVTDVSGFIAKLKAYKGVVTVDGYYEKYEGNFPYTFSLGDN